MDENASVENSPIALITMSAPAYQRRCARSNCGAGVAATDGTDDRRVPRKSRRRLKLVESSAPAVTAARRSCSENCMNPPGQCPVSLQVRNSSAAFEFEAPAESAATDLGTLESEARRGGHADQPRLR